jgi:transcriptional regulator NrdR family protein
MFSISVICTCGSLDFKIIETRKKFGMIKRRRQCKKCKTRYTTYEFIVDRKKRVRTLIDKIEDYETKINELKKELTINESSKYVKKNLELMEEGNNYIETE